MNDVKSSLRVNKVEEIIILNYYPSDYQLFNKNCIYFKVDEN